MQHYKYEIACIITISKTPLDSVYAFKLQVILSCVWDVFHLRLFLKRKQVFHLKLKMIYRLDLITVATNTFRFYFSGQFFPVLEKYHEKNDPSKFKCEFGNDSCVKTENNYLFDYLFLSFTVFYLTHFQFIFISSSIQLN